MEETGNRRRRVIDEKMKALRKKCENELWYTCYGTYLDGKEREKRSAQNWNEVQRLCGEVGAVRWESDTEYLKRCQAEAFYRTGAIYAEMGDYDWACEFLGRAKDIIEEFSFQYIMPKYCLRTYLYLAKSGIEKHSREEVIEQYYIKARAILTGMEGETRAVAAGSPGAALTDGWNAVTERQLRVELDIEWVIIKSISYQNNKGGPAEEAEIGRCLDSARETLQFLGREYSRREKKREEGRDWMKMWLRKQRDTYLSSRGVYYKWLYFGCGASLGEAADTARKKYFEEAMDSFLEGLAVDKNNTMCAGNIAALLYDYQSKYRLPEQEKFLAAMTDKIRKKTDLQTENNTAGEYVAFFLETALRADRNNMFALNLRAMSESDEKEGKKETYPYFALSQSELRRRFQKMDSCFIKKDTADKGDRLRAVKTDMIDLHTLVTRYMNETIYPRERFENLTVGHYTKSWVLSRLINQEGDAKLRIRNVKHLNDPSEGALFMGYVKRALSDTGMRESRERDCEAEENDGSMVETILQTYDYKRREEWNQKSSVYMGCFSSRIDQLNMWSRYGEQGKGCCLCIDAGETFDAGASVPLAEMASEDDGFRYRLEDNKYPLYMVTYLPGNTDVDLDAVTEYAKGRADAERRKLDAMERTADKGKKVRKEMTRCKEQENWWRTQAELVGKFKKLLKKLPVILGRIEEDLGKLEAAEAKEAGEGETDGIKKLKEEVTNTVMLILDQVRFLVKDDAYRDEREYRVIQYSYAPEYEDSGDGMPKLYVDIEKKLKYKKVIFGPLTLNYASDSAYVLNLRKKSGEKKEGESWGLDVCKSDIPYCC